MAHLIRYGLLETFVYVLRLKVDNGESYFLSDFACRIGNFFFGQRNFPSDSALPFREWPNILDLSKTKTKMAF